MRVEAKTAEDTESLGGRLARSYPERDEGLAVVYLTGELGAGKTTFARGFLRAQGIQGPVRSPSYTLLEIYETGARTTLHLDLYRLRDASELDNLGLREWAKPRHLWLIEWPERGGARLPAADVSVRLASGAQGHEIELSSHTELGESWLARLPAAPPGGS
ncbi:MAG: tRNA (adenosine(37)-N6)-threonylcarbamoyltransferase complex ATPase subunit type 1 TsaE [Gammaproteobacteria bacterium]|nr:MAG: tRNA (adenosine(37)-N6)-threonylcarbamoyltransferase complex ATPase subunit type 1 TsaE [Gammaproteobacteria bacterium]